MVSRAKYRRLTDLYVTGTEYVMKDGSVMWLQVMNQFERDEAMGDAQAARARLTLALRDVGGDEMARVRHAYEEAGREGVIDQLVEQGAGDRFMKAINSVDVDPEWAERMAVLKRADEIISAANEIETELLRKVNTEYAEEVDRRELAEAQERREEFERFTDDDLLEEYINGYIERRGNGLAFAEYALTELWFAARCCDGVKVDGEDRWDHGQCENHQLKVWESKADVKGEPDELLDALADVMKNLNMTVREAKNSHRQGSSSEPSPLPSEVEASTVSTQAETPVSPPGT